GSGAPATKAVAELVLLDNQFATLPGVVAEGRRVTANIERGANLFITKTVWATLLAVAAGAALMPYPFLPRPLTIIDTPALPAPPDDHRPPGHRRSLLLPRARAKPSPFPARIRRPGAAVHHPGRAHHRRRDVLGVRPRARPRSSPRRAAHRRDLGRAHPQPVRPRPAGHPADVAQDRAAGRRAGRLRAAVPRAGGAPLLRARAAERSDRGHAAHRGPGSRRPRRLLDRVPPPRPRAGRGGA